MESGPDGPTHYFFSQRNGGADGTRTKAPPYSSITYTKPQELQDPPLPLDPQASPRQATSPESPGHYEGSVGYRAFVVAGDRITPSELGTLQEFSLGQLASQNMRAKGSTSPFCNFHLTITGRIVPSPFARRASR